jgi:hypothetical protein
MKRIMAVSILALGLAGCNATVYDGGYYRRPSASVYVPPVQYYEPRPAYNPYVYRVPVMPQRQHCYIVDRRTPYGIRQERVCR